MIRTFFVFFFFLWLNHLMGLNVEKFGIKRYVAGMWLHFDKIFNFQRLPLYLTDATKQCVGNGVMSWKVSFLAIWGCFFLMFLFQDRTFISVSSLKMNRMISTINISVLQSDQSNQGHPKNLQIYQIRNVEVSNSFPKNHWMM